MSEVFFPKDFESRMQQRLENQWADFQKAHTLTPPVSIRLHPKKNIDATDMRSIPWTIYGKYLKQRPVFTLDPLLHAGAYYVQEASSMFLEQAVRQSIDLGQPLKVLDLSAAPGGKSTHLLSLLNEESLLVANEVIRSRASILSENIQKWGYPNCLVTNNDPKDFSELQGYFDLIVVDAPCSGEGLFRKDPDAMKEWSPENAALCASRQRRILNDVWPALKENGTLIYCTCTYNEEENEKNLHWLLQNHPVEFCQLKTESDWGVEEITTKEVTGYRFLPHRTEGEGFFISVIRKKEQQDTIRIKSKNKLPVPQKKITEVLNTWVLNPQYFKMQQHQELVYALPASMTEDIEFILGHLKFVYAGCNIASVKHDKLIPEHALSVSNSLNRKAFINIDTDLNSALQYLRRETPILAENKKGYGLICFNDTPLGWVNVLANRVNNMYPPEWRIRMSR
jgi:16S rRNA C967 or C1407 C5-methylase (RsmB/RsmF family)/NOL1/NOP2/fmu family ribosome biogenesis protein